MNTEILINYGAAVGFFLSGIFLCLYGIYALTNPQGLIERLHPKPEKSNFISRYTLKQMQKPVNLAFLKINSIVLIFFGLLFMVLSFVRLKQPYYDEPFYKKSKNHDSSQKIEH